MALRILAVTIARHDAPPGLTIPYGRPNLRAASFTGFKSGSVGGDPLGLHEALPRLELAALVGEHGPDPRPAVLVNRIGATTRESLDANTHLSPTVALIVQPFC